MYKYIRTQDINPFQEEPNIKKIKEKYIQSFTFISNWAYSVINGSSIFEFDASFKAVSLYVYSIPLVIINNESFPIGFTIGASENSILYQTFWDYLKESNIPKPNRFLIRWLDINFFISKIEWEKI